MKQFINKNTPVKIVAIGAGNRTNKYLEYFAQNPAKVRLVGVVDINEIRVGNIARRFGLTPEQCFTDYNDFFASGIEADAVMICTSENVHFDPCIKAIDAGYHVLLEKPIAPTLQECLEIGRAAKEKGVIVAVCHVMRYHPYFMKIKELATSGELGKIVSINHTSAVGLDRTTHGFVRGLWNNDRRTNPMLLAKCCHDIDFLLWISQASCRRVASFGSLRWFKAANAPEGAADRCIHCRPDVQSSCPFSAVNLYKERHEWIANFDVAEGETIDEVIDRQLTEGPYGRCVYHCDNNVVDHQIVALEMDNDVTINFSMDCLRLDDNRDTHICLTEGEIIGNEKSIVIHRFRDHSRRVIDFSHTRGLPYHAGADLNIVANFVDSIANNIEEMATSIDLSVESHRLCFEAERSRLEHRIIEL